MIYSDPSLRPPDEVLKRNEWGPSTMWALGISGDLPIVLVRIEETEDLEIVRQLIRAHAYWRMKQLAVDLVILNERATSYVQELQAALEALLRSSQRRPTPTDDAARGRVFVLRSDQIAPQAHQLQAVARAVLAPGSEASGRCGVRRQPAGLRHHRLRPHPKDADMTRADRRPANRVLQ